MRELIVVSQILAITCDNASNNDAMVTELSIQVPSFVGSASHTCCFLHIVNLIVKSLLSQFDAKKTAIDGDNKLEELAREFAEEEVAYLKKVTSNPNDNEADDANNDDGLVDETSGLTDMQQINLDRTLQPVRMALVKVCHMGRFTYAPLILII